MCPDVQIACLHATENELTSENDPCGHILSLNLFSKDWEGLEAWGDVCYYLLLKITTTRSMCLSSGDCHRMRGCSLRHLHPKCDFE
jgi:hypothetical protein